MKEKIRKRDSVFKCVFMILWVSKRKRKGEKLKKMKKKKSLKKRNIFLKANMALFVISALL